MAHYEIEFVNSRAAYDAVGAVREGDGIYLHLPPHAVNSPDASISFSSGRLPLATVQEAAKGLGKEQLAERLQDFLSASPIGAHGTLTAQVFSFLDTNSPLYAKAFERTLNAAVKEVEIIHRESVLRERLSSYTSLPERAIEAARGAVAIGATAPVAALSHDERVHTAAAPRGETTVGRS
jgi:hypothetical protein